MTITTRIYDELFGLRAATPDASVDESSVASAQLIRLPLSHPRGGPTTKRKRRSRAIPGALPNGGLGWSAEEHERFLQGLEMYPRGPWKAVAQFVGTRTVRQTMTHAQKYRQKIARRRGGANADSAISSPSSAPSSPVKATAVSTPVQSPSTGTPASHSPVSPDELIAQQALPAAWTDAFAPPMPAIEVTTGVFVDPLAVGGECVEDDASTPLDCAELDEMALDDVFDVVMAEYLSGYSVKSAFGEFGDMEVVGLDTFSIGPESLRL